MNYLDCETVTSTLNSLADILGIDKNVLLETIESLKNNLNQDDVNKVFKTAVKTANMQGFYIFHMTCCTDEMYNNIKKYGLRNMIESMKFIAEDIYEKNKKQIGESFDIYWSNIYDNAKNFQRLYTFPNKELEDDGIYGLLIYDINKDNGKFLSPEFGSEIMNDIISFLEKKYGIHVEYRKYLKPHIFKLKINKINSKYIYEAIYYLYSKSHNKIYKNQLTIKIYKYISIKEVTLRKKK